MSEPPSSFADVFEANDRFAADFTGGNLEPTAARGLAVVTCMDSRIDPFATLGIKAGDAKILRNAGARVTDDVLRTLVLAHYLLGVNRVLVMPHTNCRMASASEVEIHDYIQQEYGVDTRSLEFRTTNDQRASLVRDVGRIESYPLLPRDLDVCGAILDITTGRLDVVSGPAKHG
jgi:carbonic anhydrase